MHSTSFQLNKPQRYVMWQLIAILAEKCIYLPIVYFAHDMDDSILLCKMMDAAFVPLLIQMAYLGCNGTFLKILYYSCAVRSNNNAVAPAADSTSSSD
ncbi:unnamed protein product [Caenorhabditis brenneri]